MDNTEKIQKIHQKFNRHLFKIFKVADKYHPNNIDLQHAKSMARIARDMAPERIMDEAGSKLWDQKDNIIKRNTKFFLEADNLSNYANDKKTKDFVESMISFIRQEYTKISPEDLSNIWDYVNTMLRCTIEYKMINKEYIQ
jgi:hypothetical protein